jgi:hypothetical protein
MRNKQGGTAMSNDNEELIKALNEAYNAIERAINTLRNQAAKEPAKEEPFARHKEQLERWAKIDPNDKEALLKEFPQLAWKWW